MGQPLPAGQGEDRLSGAECARGPAAGADRNNLVLRSAKSDTFWRHSADSQPAPTASSCLQTPNAAERKVSNALELSHCTAGKVHG